MNSADMKRTRTRSLAPGRIRVEATDYTAQEFFRVLSFPTTPARAELCALIGLPTLSMDEPKAHRGHIRRDTYVARRPHREVRNEG